MSDSKLVVCEQARGKFYIGWYFRAEGEFGAFLDEYGLGMVQEASNELDRRDDIEHHAACKAVSALADGCDHDGYFWESKRRAQAALKAATAAIASVAVDMPEWAEKALAAGWKAPKGWKP